MEETGKGGCIEKGQEKGERRRVGPASTGTS